MIHAISTGARPLVGAVVAALLCSACGSLLPIVKVGAPPSATEAELNKGTASCAPTSTTVSGAAKTDTNCPPPATKK